VPSAGALSLRGVCRLRLHSTRMRKNSTRFSPEAWRLESRELVRKIRRESVLPDAIGRGTTFTIEIERPSLDGISQERVGGLLGRFLREDPIRTSQKS
jgi:hypothetical protein